MKSTFITIILIFQSLVSFGQLRQLTDEDYNSSGANKLVFVSKIEKAKELAQTDIENETPFLLIKSGIAPVVYTTDSIFENQFRVYYYEQGDIGPEYAMMNAYNQVIFEYLDQKYGKEWRKSVRKDVIGFEKWKGKN